MARRPHISWRWAILVGWCGFLFFYGLSGPLYRTEALRAIIGQSALDGHWLTPTLYGEPFLTKPPGIYAAIGLASWPAGRVTEETARLPSAIAAALTVLFAFATLRQFVDGRKAFIAALLLPISFLWLDKVPSAEIDMLQLAWVSAALMCFLRTVGAHPPADAGGSPVNDSPSAGGTLQIARTPGVCRGMDTAPCVMPVLCRSSLAWSVAALLCVAGGFLTKWTAPAFFYLTVGPFLVWRGRWRWLFGRDHLIAAAIAVLLCAAWAAAVASQVGWDTLSDTVAREASPRFAPKANGKPYPWAQSLAFPAIVLAAHLPWSIPALFALRPTFLRGLDEKSRLLVQLLHCWAWPNLLFWSLPAQHNVRYILPICPAITLLGVIVVLHWVEYAGTSIRRLASPRTALVSVLLAWIVVKIVFVEAVVRDRTSNRNARETGEEIARLVPPGEI
ncbi:MAG TPA: glycosyltransferase family 39 protein, partial [Gemmataceae bacterium]|nr:glycosyltransferase family 39 protein [Gemmataceae bacterium]